MVKRLKHNLLNVSQFPDRGFKVDFHRDMCLVSYRKTGDLVFKGVRKGSLFVTDMSTENKNKVCYFYFKASSDEWWLWYKKLSHLNFKAIDTLIKRDLVRDMPALEFFQKGVCKACQKSKKQIDQVTRAKLKIPLPLH